MAESAQSVYDVAIIGGALAGAATAVLLLRQNPELRVVILERSSSFGRRVGEATVEVSGYFLNRVLGLSEHLNHCHLIKQGMRFWFYSARSATLADCTEIGGRYLSRVPAFQVDRAVLDEEVLQLAVSAGAELRRPATVARVSLLLSAVQEVELRCPGHTENLRARWVVDASGVAAVLARQQGWWRSNSAHPVSAVWARWKGVKNWDGLELAGKYPEWAAACQGLRGTATNHLVGRGWWAWCIPLKGGDTSIGLVFDERLVQWPEEGSVGERLKTFLFQHPVARELLANAQWIEGDMHFRKHLPYYSSTFSGDGFVLVGDASAFLDPLYSPGMDWVAFTTTAAVSLIVSERSGQPVAPLIEKHNRDFSGSYQHWFEALYRDKYEYIGDYDLMRVAFLLDLGLYYLGVASQPYKYGPAALNQPVFSSRVSMPFFHLMRLYNRRLARIARARIAQGTWGRHNDGFRQLIPGFTFAPSSALSLVKALAAWARLELGEGWRAWP